MEKLIENLQFVLDSNISKKNLIYKSLLEDFLKDIKVTKYVICNETRKTWDITEGKKYKVFNETDTVYTIKNDLKQKVEYNKQFFRKL